MKLNGKKLLILGANPETASLVVKANELGVITYVTDYDSKAFAKQYATYPCDIDASHVDELYDLVEKEKIDGVIVGVAERLIPFYTALCERLNFPCFGTNQIFDLMIDKRKFKNVCRQYNVPVILEYNIREYGNLEELESIHFPVVVKPVDSCSSKGISVCKTVNELQSGVKKALSFSVSKTLIIEKYMTGEEVVIYYIIQDGEPILVAMCDRYCNKEQKGVAQLPTSYVYPSKYIDSYISEVDDNMRNMIKGIGIKNGTLFIQAFIEDGKIQVYEPGFRLNGAQEHFIVSEITGIDAKECLINFALTGKMSDDLLREKAKPRFEKIGCKLSPLVREGKIARMEGLEDIYTIPGVVSINPSYHEGDIVEGLGTLKQIVCRFFVVSDTKEHLKEVLDQIYEKFRVLDEAGCSMLLNEQFDTNILMKY